jgi:protein farnesyltransferase subunit beta
VNEQNRKRSIPTINENAARLLQNNNSKPKSANQCLYISEASFMTFHIKGTKDCRKVRFANKARTSSAHLQHTAQERTGFITEELPEDIAGEENWEEDPSEELPMTTSAAAQSLIPDLYTSFPLIRDILTTETSQVQDETVQECLPYLTGRSGKFTTYNKDVVPHLDRTRHVRFLHKSLQNLPSPFVAADAARPWFFYWALCGLRALGEDVSSYRERLISTVRPIQNATGGFGGGHGQLSHLATTYAIVLSLAMVGGTDAMELIDRKAMWRWLGSIKQRDGGFQMFIGGEEDVRYARPPPHVHIYLAHSTPLVVHTVQLSSYLS